MHLRGDYNDGHITDDHFSPNEAAKFSDWKEAFFSDQKNVPNKPTSWSQAQQRETAK